MHKFGFGSADAMQVMAEAEKRAYADRSEYLGDPDFVKVPWQALTNKAYAKSIADQIDINKAKPSSEIRPGKLAPYESNQTTHFSVVDKDGNAVAVTYTLNTTFGTGIVAGNSGILLNNEMDDFSAKPGVPNVYGLVGGDANAVASEEASAVVHVANHRGERRENLAGDRQPWREPHHNYRATDGGEQHRLWHERRRGDQCAAFPSSVAAG